MRVTLAVFVRESVDVALLARSQQSECLKRGGKVFTKVVNDVKTEALLPMIARKIAPDSTVYTRNVNSDLMMELQNNN